MDVPVRKIISPPKGKDGLFVQPHDFGPNRERDEQHNRDRLASHYKYADLYTGNTRTFDPSGNYKCGECNQANAKKCMTVGTIKSLDRNAGSCGDWENTCAGDFEINLGYKNIEQAGYAIAVNGQGFGCQRCPFASKAYQPDSRGRTFYCGKGDCRVMWNACCNLNGAKSVKIDDDGIPLKNGKSSYDKAEQNKRIVRILQST